MAIWRCIAHIGLGFPVGKCGGNRHRAIEWKEKLLSRFGRLVPPWKKFIVIAPANFFFFLVSAALIAIRVSFQPVKLCENNFNAIRFRTLDESKYLTEGKRLQSTQHSTIPFLRLRSLNIENVCRSARWKIIFSSRWCEAIAIESMLLRRLKGRVYSKWSLDSMWPDVGSHIDDI